jgi:hypothetical protein
MSRVPDTGESTAKIIATTNEVGWRRVLPMLQAGSTLRRDSRTRRSYVDGWGSLTDRFVKTKVDAGDLVQTGIFEWRLALNANQGQQ